MKEMMVTIQKGKHLRHELASWLTVLFIVSTRCPFQQAISIALRKHLAEDNHNTSPEIQKMDSISIPTANPTILIRLVLPDKSLDYMVWDPALDSAEQ
jgi:hypothetical protein